MVWIFISICGLKQILVCAKADMPESAPHIERAKARAFCHAHVWFLLSLLDWYSLMFYIHIFVYVFTGLDVYVVIALFVYIVVWLCVFVLGELLDFYLSAENNVETLSSWDNVSFFFGLVVSPFLFGYFQF